MIILNQDTNTSLYKQLYIQIKEDIIHEILLPDTKLDATRIVAKELGVSRNTVTAAYHQLELEEYVYSVKGSGFYVNRVNNLDILKNKIPISPLLWQEPNTKKENIDDFYYGSVETEIFPMHTWRKCILTAFDKISNAPTLTYMNKKGEYKLRTLLTNYLYRTRGVKCNPEQLIITSGHQHSLEILTKLFDKNEYSFTMEEPGHRGTRTVFEMNSYEMHEISLEKDGICIEELEKLKNTLLHITPSHQFPTGLVYQISKRLSILDWADKNHSFIIEDDYDNELRYHTLPLPSLQSLDCHQRTIYLGTFSKSLSPDLRISYIVLPEMILNIYEELFRLIHCTVPRIIQLAIIEFIENGSYQRHVNTLKTYYKKKYDRLCFSLKSYFGDNVTVEGDGAGLHILITLHCSYTQNEIMEKAYQRSVKVYPTSIYWKRKENSSKSQILLGFSSININDIPSAVEQLYKAVMEV